MRIFILIMMMSLLMINAFAAVDTIVQESQWINIKLPDPNITGGKPLMQVLNERKSSRAFSSEQLPLQILSDLLWATFGINRPDSAKRTAPTAMNMQQIDVYVAMDRGLYFYDPIEHLLKLVLKEDIRAITGKQDFVADAPVNLIFVADYSKMDKAGDLKDFYAATDTGFISENVYLYCASADLATVTRGWIDKEALLKAMGLRPDQKIILAQTVGYSK